MPQPPAGVTRPFAPGFTADPYPFYAWLRETDPVHYVEAMDVVLVSRYAEVTQVLGGPAFQKQSPDTGQSALAQATGMKESMLTLDPPDHTRLRTLVNRAFTPQVVERLRPHVDEIAHSLLDAVAGRGRMDLVSEFAFPLPATVIAELLGVPVEDRERFRAWSKRFIFLTDATRPPEVLADAREAQDALLAYFTELIADRRRGPREDFLGGLIAAEEAGDRLSAEELVAMCILLLVAGHETTANLLASGTLTLLRHPAELDALRDAMRRQPPSVVTAVVVAAVEELLRYESPVQWVGRFPGADVELAGRHVRRGQRILALLGSANRDAAAFSDPDRLDLGRRDNRHVAFGRGIHFCLGAPLARLEAQVAFPLLLTRLPRLELAAERVEWSPNATIRSLRALPVRF